MVAAAPGSKGRWTRDSQTFACSRPSTTGADILAVACPYCLQMFEDAVKTLDLEIEVKDVSELLVEAL